MHLAASIRREPLTAVASLAARTSPIIRERSRVNRPLNLRVPGIGAALFLLVLLAATAAPAALGAHSPTTRAQLTTPRANSPTPGAPGIDDPYYPLLGNGGDDDDRRHRHTRPVDIQPRFPRSPD